MGEVAYLRLLSETSITDTVSDIIDSLRPSDPDVLRKLSKACLVMSRDLNTATRTKDPYARKKLLLQCQRDIKICKKIIDQIPDDKIKDHAWRIGVKGLNGAAFTYAKTLLKGEDLSSMTRDDFKSKFDAMERAISIMITNADNDIKKEEKKKK